MAKGPKARFAWMLAFSVPSLTTFPSVGKAESGSFNPCNTKDPGFGIYSHWDRSPLKGQMLAPQRGGIGKDGAFDVMFHFHGHEVARKEWVRVMDGAVLVGIDLGIGSGPYEQAFQAPEAFRQLVESVERAVAKNTGRPTAHARHIGLSAWSAGYGAVQTLLTQPYAQRVVDSVILIDGLHSGYANGVPNAQQLKPFLDFARRAAAGEKFMFISHSAIVPPGYASTTETAHFVVNTLGGHPHKSSARPGDPERLSLIERYTKGNFHARGFSGNGKFDHCAQIGLLRDILQVHIKPRWNSPKGRAE
ncbi:MAG TPA: hypothetical protein VGJ84_04450 [Polyangiaceae bacterium]|jgi:hypothetical protein